MNGVLAAFALAVAGAALVCYAVMTRLPNRRANRGSSFDGSGADGGDDAGPNWFGGSHHSASTDFSGDSSSPADSGSSVGAGGGDSGGGSDASGGSD